MTPAELLQIKEIVAKAVRESEQRLQDELVPLREVDKRVDSRLSTHSGSYRDLAANVRTSEAKIKEATGAQILSVVEDLRDEFNEKLAAIPKAAQGAESAAVAGAHAALAAKGATTDIAIQQIATKEKIRKSDVHAQWRFYVGIFAFGVAEVIRYLMTSAPPPH